MIILGKEKRPKIIKTSLWEANNNNKLTQVRRKEIRKGKQLI